MTVSKIFCENIREPTWKYISDFSLKEAVDLWRIPISSHIPFVRQLTEVFSKSERERVDRYHQQKDKVRFSLGRGMLRVLLSRYVGCSPMDIQFNKGFNNKPLIDSSESRHFNISYSNNWIIIAVSSEPVGVDIEYVNETFEYPGVMEGCFMKEEIDVISTASKPRNMFFQSWTRKEALLKAVSWGLDDSINEFSCLDGMQVLSKKFDGIGDWNIKSFLMEGNYQVSLAFKHQQSIRYCSNSIPAFLGGKEGQ